MHPKPILPVRLKPGSRVALVAPSGPLPELEDIARATENCRFLGLEPVVMPNCGKSWCRFTRSTHHTSFAVGLRRCGR